MKYQNIGSVSGSSKSQVFVTENFNDGYAVQVSCSASNTPNISVYESVGKYDTTNGAVAPLVTEVQYWQQVDTSGAASATTSYIFNRAQFRGKFVYVDVTATSMSDTEILFNPKK